jgi:hypothetical protein
MSDKKAAGPLPSKECPSLHPDSECLEEGKRELRGLEDKFDLQTFIELRKHISIVHHVKGRIRLKIALNFIKRFSHVSLSDLESLFRSIEGVKGIRMIWSARSVVICYDPHLISSELWQGLLMGDEEEVAKIVHAIGIDGMFRH